MTAAREVRIRQIPDHYDGWKWHTHPQPLVEVTSGAWMLVRRADSPTAMPFVISRKDWAKLPPEGEE